MNKENQKIDPQLESLLDELRDVPARDPRRAARGRAQFLSLAVSAREETVSRNPIRRLKEWLDNTKQKKEKFRMSTLVTVLTILTLLAGGGAGIVYAAQDSLPTDTLYPVKLYSEEFRMNMAGDPAEELALMLQFAQRRGDEIEQMMAEGVEPTAENMLQLSQQTQQAMQLAGALDGAAMLQVQNMIQNQMQRMLNLQANASEEGAMLMEQTRTALQIQLRLAGGGDGPGSDQGQGQNQGQSQGQNPDQGQGQGQDQNQGQGQDQDQGQNQGEMQSQGSGNGSGQADTAPGAENGEQGEQFANQGEDPCAAYYASLAQGQGQSRGKGQGESQGPVVYGLNGEVCAMPTVAP